MQPGNLIGQRFEIHDSAGSGGILDALGAELRLVLRAASVFGEKFWRGGVIALVGGDPSAVRDALDELTAREITERLHSCSMSGEVEYVFRHALVRDAAYAMLTDADRVLGHAVAGDWLEQAGETDPIALAQHFDPGGKPARALGFYKRGAEQALEGNDFAGALERADRGIACGPDPETLCALWQLQAEAHYFRGGLILSEQLAFRAAGRLAIGSAPWFGAVATLIRTSGQRGQNELVEEWTARAAAAVAAPDAKTAQILCLCRGLTQLFWAHRDGAAGALANTLMQLAPDTGVLPPEVAAAVHRVRAELRMSKELPFEIVLREYETTCVLFERAGAYRDACLMRLMHAAALAAVGDPHRAEPLMRSGLDEAERLAARYLVDLGRSLLGFVYVFAQKYDLARETLRASLQGVTGSLRIECDTRMLLALAHLGAGELEAAETEARKAAEMPVSDALRSAAQAIIARTLVAQGRAREALPLARSAVELSRSSARFDVFDRFADLSLAETLDALGERQAGCGVLQRALDRVLGVTRQFEDPVLRQRYLERPHPNHQIVSLARAWELYP